MDFKYKYLKYKEKYLSLKNNLDLNIKTGGNKFKKGDFVNFLFDPTKTLIGIVNTEKQIGHELYFVITSHNPDDLVSSYGRAMDRYVISRSNPNIHGVIVGMGPLIMVRGIYKESDLIQQNIAEVAASKDQYVQIEQMMKNLGLDNDEAIVPPPGLARPPPGLARPPPPGF
jgi:hypothetical protein